MPSRSVRPSLCLPLLVDADHCVSGYPLRPEFIESNWSLYQATKDEHYLEIAERVLHDLNNRTRVDCGFAAIHNLETGLLEDKMPSFLISETLKYLFLTFDEVRSFILCSRSELINVAPAQHLQRTGLYFHDRRTSPQPATQSQHSPKLFPRSLLPRLQSRQRERSSFRPLDLDRKTERL